MRFASAAAFPKGAGFPPWVYSDALTWRCRCGVGCRAVTSVGLFEIGREKKHIKAVLVGPAGLFCLKLERGPKGSVAVVTASLWVPVLQRWKDSRLKQFFFLFCSFTPAVPLSGKGTLLNCL